MTRPFGTGRRLLTLEHEDPAADVLVVTSGWPHELNETYCVFIKRQVESLIARGLHCDVLFVRGFESKRAYVRAALVLSWWSVRGRRRYRLVHAHGGEAALAAAAYRRAPLLVSFLGSDLLGSPRSGSGVTFPGRLRRSAIRQSSRLAARTITKSREMETVLPAAVRERNSVIPNGVDPDLFRPLGREAARRALGWDADAPVALFAANPSVAVKRYGLALAATEEARRALPDLRLEVARGVAPDRMPLLMNAADCLLLTSSTEGSPNVVKEALMCNLPVVATPAGDVEELLEGVVPSFVCAPSAAALSSALVDCVTDPRRSNGRETSSHLDARVIADRLLGLYDEIAGGLRRTAAQEDCAAPRAV
jgi:teichuronic acid biosynthesis glycosyltransferase TuaC